MAEVSWPASSYNSGAVTEAEYEKIAAHFSSDGLYGSPLNAARVVAGAGLQVLVKANTYASLRGFFYNSGSTDVPLDIDPNSSGATRVDRVVLRLDRSTWLVRAAIRKGTPGAGPPALVKDQWDTGIFEIPLALVTVPNGAAAITSADIQTTPYFVGNRSRAQLSGFRDPNPFPGQINWDLDTDTYVRWNGSSWKTIIEDTGWVPLAIDWTTVWQGAATSPISARKVNGVVSVRIEVTRIGSSLGVTDPDGSRICTVPTNMRAGNYHYFACQFAGAGGAGGIAARLQLRPDGSIWCTAPTTTVPTGRHLRQTITYMP